MAMRWVYCEERRLSLGAPLGTLVPFLGKLGLRAQCPPALVGVREAIQQPLVLVVAAGTAGVVRSLG